MSNSIFHNVMVNAIKTVIPEKFIDIDEELLYFDNNPKKLARAKKMVGYGRRYLLDENSTVTDMCVDAAEKLLAETNTDRQEIDLLIFVNQKPDYKEPCDACLAHGRLGLAVDCAALDISLGCSGYPYGLWTAHAMIASGAAKKCLLLVGDAPSRVVHPKNRKNAQLFGDAASATLLEYTDGARPAYFVMGTDGTGWDKLIVPFGGLRLPVKSDVINLELEDTEGNFWTIEQSLMSGADVFNFSIEVGSRAIHDVLNLSKANMNDIDFFCIHQANKQIVDAIASKAGIPAQKTTTETFTKYANNSTNSVVTVLCDQLKNKISKNVIICAFGIGLSWGCCLLDLSKMYNGGISTYLPKKDQPTRNEQIAHWSNYFKGEQS